MRTTLVGGYAESAAEFFTWSVPNNSLLLERHEERGRVIVGLAKREFAARERRGIRNEIVLVVEQKARDLGVGRNALPEFATSLTD